MSTFNYMAVASQTALEGRKSGVEAAYSRDGKKAACGITIINYEMLCHFNLAKERRRGKND